MQLRLQERIVLAAPPAEVWVYCTDIDNMPSFAGYGPLPGIREARWRASPETPPFVGAKRDIENLDGTRHVEEIVACEPPNHLTDRISEFQGPPRFFLRAMRDAFTFQPQGEGTLLLRELHIELRSAWWWPIGLVARALLRRALRRHHEVMAEHFAQCPK